MKRYIARLLALTMIMCWFDAQAGRAQSSIPVELKHGVHELQRFGRLTIGPVTIAAHPPLLRIYEQDAFAPLWTDPNTSRELVRALRDLGADGLTPADYNLAQIEERSMARLTSVGGAELELLRTDALLRAAYDLRFGKIDPRQMRPRRSYHGGLRTADAAADLRGMITSGRLYDELFGLRPAHFVYRGLVQALAELRAIERTGGWPLMSSGRTMRRDSMDARVPHLRERLIRTGDLPRDAAATGLRFEAALERAIQSFQHRHGLNPDGVVGPATLAELNVPVSARIDQLRLNLERARWSTHELPETFVAVNIAGAMVYFVKSGSVLLETRAVVGRTSTTTPVFRADLTHIELNPTWTVPPGIVGEVLRAIRRNPEYLEQEGIRVLTHGGQELDASRINFARYSGSSFPHVFRQDPGPRNPLGMIKLVFPNRYNVYLHDTPAQELFERERRTFSHGCIRVDEPLQLAALILNDSSNWSVEAPQAAIETGITRTIRLDKPIPVLVLYWTASADLRGELHFYRDVYGLDAALMRALNLR